VEARQQLAIREREALQAFAQAGYPSADYEAVNPGALRLSQHIAAYRLTQSPHYALLDDEPRILVNSPERQQRVDLS